MSSDALHVFVCFGALPFEASLRILAERRREDPSCAAALLVTFEADEARIPSDVRVFRLSPPMHTYSRWQKPFKVAAWFEQVHRELLSMASGRLHVYVAHPAELPEIFHGLVEFGILASQRAALDPIDRALKRVGDEYLAKTEHIHDDWSLVQEYPLSRELLAL